jgi:hypothetical protein
MAMLGVVLLGGPKRAMIGPGDNANHQKSSDNHQMART